ncbi:hypothetical protein KF707_05590 [Candidatus Obscuribacterales bacterium]|nr:hypothetical protein [Candidatus Obscuribacterales bacterium]
MPDSLETQSNSCAYCLKPVADDFICAECMSSRKVSMEQVRSRSEEIEKPKTLIPKTTPLPRQQPSAIDTASTEPPTKGLKRSTGSEKKKNWKDYPLHSDFQKVERKANMITYVTMLPVAIVGFGVASMFGFPFFLALCIGVAIGIGWAFYRAEQKTWYHYASWVLTQGQKLECNLDLVSSGELDLPYIVLRDENRITRIYETRVFKLVSGDIKKLLHAVDAPGTKTQHHARAYYDTEMRENAVVFKIGDSLLWCRAHHSRGI